MMSACLPALNMSALLYWISMPTQEVITMEESFILHGPPSLSTWLEDSNVIAIFIFEIGAKRTMYRHSLYRVVWNIEYRILNVALSSINQSIRKRPTL